jgi:hypothetical protein
MYRLSLTQSPHNSLNAQGHTQFSKVHPMNLAALAGGLQSVSHITLYRIVSYCIVLYRIVIVSYYCIQRNMHEPIPLSISTPESFEIASGLLYCTVDKIIQEIVQAPLFLFLSHNKKVVTIKSSWRTVSLSSKRT